MFSNTVFAGKDGQVVNIQPVNGYKINANAPAVFESFTPDLVEIVRQDGQNVEINLHGDGDGYLAIHYRSGHEFIYHFIIKKDADDASKFSVHDVAQQVLTDCKVVAALVEGDAENLFAFLLLWHIVGINLNHVVAAFALGL